MKRAALFALALASSSAWPFFDGFDGGSLGAHWDFFSEGSLWEYNVSAGRLNVTRVYGPFEFDQVAIVSHIEPYESFDASARVAWGTGLVQQLRFGISEEYPFFSPLIGSVNYRATPAVGGLVSAVLDGQGSSAVPVPNAGEFTFRVVRGAGLLSAYLDGMLLLSVPSGSTGTANRIFLEFGAAEPMQFGGLHADWVQVVPEPSSIFALGGSILALLKRRRTSSARP